MTPQYAEIAVGLPVPTTFHYRIPKRLKEKIAVGKRVWVPFRQRQLLGYVAGFAQRPEVQAVKPIAQVLDEHPILEPELLKLTRWMADTYQAGWGQTIQTALPGPLRRGISHMTPQAEEPMVAVCPTTPLSLNTEQRKALEIVVKAIAAHRHRAFLLHGVTGSGKTEVYLQAIEEVLHRGRSSIVLVPEISLTPQAVERFQGRFGASRVAVLHSGMLESRRLQEWHRIRSGQARVVVGARSAVFAPVRDLGLLVVDEEHEPSYKQEDAPRYHAREVALTRGKLSQAPVILGSATPSMEAYYLATHRRYQLLALRERVEEIPLPQVEVVDMRQELTLGRRGRIFSRRLEESLTEILSHRQQAILFLNRRGFSTRIQCRGCGYVAKCKACQVTLTYHIQLKSLICHTCRACLPAPEVCPRCRSEYVRFQGIGTQRVESELARLFPTAHIARMDTDATSVRGSHAEILHAFKEQRIDLLVGTQMVAKGLDFPQVTLVGVISADTALYLPDFRSAERTFHLLTQVAGRAGRGNLPGRVVVQTYTPHHYAIVCASQQDYQAFYKQEIAIRRQLHLPPFTRLVQLIVRSLREGKALNYAQRLAESCHRHLPKGVEILGPAPHPIHRIRRQYRWQILLKSASLRPIQENLRIAVKGCRPPQGCLLAIDVDPL